MTALSPQLPLVDMDMSDLTYFVEEYLFDRYNKPICGYGENATDLLERLECEIITMSEQYSWNDSDTVLSPTTIYWAYKRMFWRALLKELFDTDPNKKKIANLINERIINRLPRWVEWLKKNFAQNKATLK